MKQIKRLFQIDPWKIRTTHLDKENLRLQESLTSIGNGYMGMRGNFEEHYSGDHHQGTYLACLVSRQNTCWLVEKWLS